MVVGCGVALKVATELLCGHCCRYGHCDQNDCAVGVVGV